MDGLTGSPTDGKRPPPPNVNAGGDEACERGLSRREFAARAGVGSAAAAGLFWASPKISTVRSLRKAAIGSPPPTSVTTSPPVGPLGGQIFLSATSLCLGDKVHVDASGFAPGTTVTLHLESSSAVLGSAVADSTGSIGVAVVLPTSAATGAQVMKAVGVQQGGQALTVSAPITIKTAADCAGSTTTTTKSPVGAAGERGTATSEPAASAGDAGGGSGGNLPFTGGEATDLALMGGAAILGGRVIHRMTKHRLEGRDAVDE